MAIAYKSAGAGVATEASGGNLNPACPATVDAGDILIAHVAYEGTSTTPSTPSGWEVLGGATGYTVETAYKHWIFGKIAAGTEDGSAISFGTPAVTTMRTGRIYSFSGRVSGTISELVPSTSFAHLSHATDPQMPTVTTTVAGAKAVACIFQADDNTQADATGATGGTWAEAVAEYTQLATTPDSALGLQTCTPTADPGTVTGGSISTANDPCGVIGFEIRPSKPAVSMTAETGAFTLTGKDVTLTYTRKIDFSAEKGAFTLTGNDATLALVAPPTVALNTADDTAFVLGDFPVLEFTGTDANSDDILYEIQIDTANTFDSQEVTNLSDNFSDGNYTSNPAWTSASGFTVNNSVANTISDNEYALASTAAGTIYTPSSQAYGVWEFDIYYNSLGMGDRFYAPISSGTDPVNHNGYTLVINYQGNWSFRRYTGTGYSALVTYTNASLFASQTWYRVKIVRNSTVDEYVNGAVGTFALYYSTDGTNFTLLTATTGSNPVTNDVHTTSTNFVYSTEGSGDRISNIIAQSGGALIRKVSGTDLGFADTTTERISNKTMDSNITGWTSTSFTETHYATDDDSIGRTNVLKCVATAVSAQRVDSDDAYFGADIPSGSTIRIHFSIYIPSTNTSMDGVEVFDYYTATQIFGTSFPTANTWTHEVINATLAEIKDGLGFRGRDGAVTTTLTIGDKLYLDNISLQLYEADGQYPSGNKISYAHDGGLTDNTTYYWRVRGKDPAGSNTYGAWSETRSFTVGDVSAAVIAEKQSYILTGKDATLTVQRTILAEKQVYTLTGKDAALAKGYQFTCEKGTFTFTGNDVAFKVDRKLNAEVQSYTLTGKDATLTTARYLLAEKQTYTLTGKDVTFVKGYQFICEKAAFTLSGKDVTLKVDRKLNTEVQSFVFTGKDITLVRGYVFNVNPDIIESGGTFVANAEANNFTDWNTNYQLNGANSIVDFRHKGEYGYKHEVYGGATQYANLRKNVSGDEFYARFYFYIPTGAVTDTSTNTFIMCSLRSITQTGTQIGVQFNASNAPYRYYCVGGGGSTYSTTNWALDTWHYAELYYKKGTGANSEHRVWVDGSLLFEKTNGSHTESIDRFLIGFQQNGTATDGYYYDDSIKISTSAIGAYQETFVSTGNNVSFTLGRFLSAESQAYTVSFKDAELTSTQVNNVSMDAETVAFTLVGKDATLTQAKLLNAEKQTYTLTLNDAQLSKVGMHSIDAESQSYTLTGNDVQFRYFSMPAVVGEFILTGKPVDFNSNKSVDVEKAAFTLSGKDVTFLTGRKLNAEKQTYTLTGNDAKVGRGLFINGEKQTYTVTYKDATFKPGRAIVATKQTYVVSGKDADLVYYGLNTDLIAESGSFRITGKTVQMGLPSILYYRMNNQWINLGKFTN